MRDIREKIATVAGFKGHGSIARAAEKIGVSQRTLHRALTSGPSAKLREIIDAAEESALMEKGCGDRGYENELREVRKIVLSYVKRVSAMKRDGVPIEEQLRSERTLGYLEALLHISRSRDRNGWLMYHLKAYAGQIRQHAKP